VVVSSGKDLVSMHASPSLGKGLRRLWQLRGTGIKKMGRVRVSLWRVVYSHLSDDEAADSIAGVVKSEPDAADATLKYLSLVLETDRSYDVDRAYRILTAAIKGEPTQPIRAENAALFERERQLGWMPLSQAFKSLSEVVPELDAIRVYAEQAARSPTEFGIARADKDQVVIRSGVGPPNPSHDADRLVGPKSQHPDPLIRSPVALRVAVTYPTAVLAASTDRALWDPERGPRRVSRHGSFFGTGPNET
jgi:hypothetical protein